MKKFINKIYRILSGLILLYKASILLKKKFSDIEILMFFPFYHIGGAEKVHLDIVKSVGNSKKVAILFTNKSVSEEFKNEFFKSAICIDVSRIRLKGSVFINAKLEQIIIKRINASSIHYTFGCNSAVYYKCLPHIKKSIFRYDLIHAVTDTYFLNKLLIDNVKHINNRIVINNKAKMDLAGLYVKFNINSRYLNYIKIIGNGININNDGIPEVQKDQKFNVGFVGRWSEEKRPELFLKIASHFEGSGKKISFQMAGPGMDEQKLKENAVKYLGVMKDKDQLDFLYHNLSLLLITSKSEGFPMVIMEAMFHGVIPICTDVGGIGEHITPATNGFLIPNKEESELVKDFVIIIRRLYNNSHELNRIANNCHDYAKNNFDIKIFNKEYRQLFGINSIK